MRILGLDEAGRGSVLGPLVVGAFLWECAEDPGPEPAGQQALRDVGADDSKGMSAKKRATVREALGPLGQGTVVQVTARQIDGANINTLEEHAFLELVVQTRPDRLYLDAPCHPRAVPRLRTRMAQAIARAGVAVPEMIIEPKADSTWPVVGAASIFAKTTRDAAMVALSASHGVPLGSGYPSDPKSRAWIAGFLARDEPLPACVRSRWGTIEKLRQQTMF